MPHDEVTQINAAYPEIRIHSARQLTNSGQFSNVLIVNDSLVFRFPRTPHVVSAMVREVSILSAIKGRLTLPVPDPIYVHTDPQTGTLVFMGYSMLFGEPIASSTLLHQSKQIVQRFAKQLADFLRELHGIAPDSLGMDLPIEGTREEWVKMYEEFTEKLYPFMRPDSQANVSNTFETALNDATLWSFVPVLRHGDFGTGNILYDPQTMHVTGIIDFGFSSIGDPAQDIGAVWSLGDNFMFYFWSYFPEMRATLPRVKFIRSTYALQQALYALRDGNQDDFEDGIQNYR